MRLLLTALLCLAWSAVGTAADGPVRVLYLGDQGHHRPKPRFDQLAPAMEPFDIELTYTETLDDLNAETLAKYDALAIYANIEKIGADQEAALLNYVKNGGGLVALHCASFCFHNSPKYIELVGAQFQKHGTGTFRVRQEPVDHPILKGFGGFESWDETYTHHRHNLQGRTVLETRVEKDQEEPWTWVRTEGDGRVFYTAWGHDERTFGNAGFQNLVARGIRWAAKADLSNVPNHPERPEFVATEMTPIAKDLPPFKYVDVGAKIPNYPKADKWGVQEKPLSSMQLPLPAAESIKHYSVPAGAQLKLYAAEPQLAGKPIAMNWDERGRLWVCETYDYPNELQPQGKGRDRIRVCADTDNDGVADTFTTFAEKLSIPTAIVAAHGGVIVQDGTETVFFKDTDGDGKADVRHVLVTGWALGDTHGGVSNFQYGLDNWFWGMQGYNDSHPVIADGKEVQGFRMGFFRFKTEVRKDGLPYVTDLEFVRSTDNNTWGIGFSEEGLVFGSTANHNPSVFMPIPNRYYERVRGWGPQTLRTIADTHLFKAVTENVRQMDHHGGYTAGAGHALYTARNYPEPWWNRTAFVCEPTGHLVGTFVLAEHGTAFSSTSPQNLVASDDEWASPIMAEVGPDGNVWVLDWYNFIIQHNPTPVGFTTGKGNAYETDLRDKKHGRVYRLEWPGRGGTHVTHSTTLDLAEADAAALVKALSSDNLYWRKQAQRLLVEGNVQDAIPGLVALLKDDAVDELGLNPPAMHALWGLEGLGAVTPKNTDVWSAVLVATTHPSSGVRRNAIEVLAKHPESDAALLDHKILEDEDPQVRLAAALAFADLPPSDQAAEAVLNALGDANNQQDRWLPEALTSAAARNDAAILKVLARRKSSLNQPGTLKALGIVAEHYARGESAKTMAEVLTSLNGAPPEVVAAVLTGFNKGWPKGAKAEFTDEQNAKLSELFKAADPALRSTIFALSARMGNLSLGKYADELAAGFVKTVQDDDAGDADRIAAARQLVELRPADGAAVGQILEAVSVRTSPELTNGLLAALARSEAADAGVAIIEHLGSITPSSQANAFRTLLSRSEWTKALVEAASEGKASLAALSLDQKQSLASHPDKSVAGMAKKLLATGGGLPNADRQKVVTEYAASTQMKGDIPKGKELFKTQCAKCHTYQGEGQKIGPDLTGMAVHPKAELLVHILDPSRSVEGNFRVYTVATDDGRVFNGLMASESKTAIELIDSEAKRQSINRGEIEELIASPKSLMPEGFEKQITPAGMADLLEYLTQRGKYVPLPLEKVATAVSTRGLFLPGNRDYERLIFPDWKPKTVEGIPFVLVDPQGEKQPNVVLLNGPQGELPPRMPKSVTIPCQTPAKAIHLLGGISGWGFPAAAKGTTSMTVRLTYADGKTEDHELKNGVHFADFIRRVDVPGSTFAFDLGGPQVRYLKVQPKRADSLESIELIKGPDSTAPVTLAITVETP